MSVRGVCDLTPRGCDEGAACSWVDEMLGRSEAAGHGSWPGGEIDPDRWRKGCGELTIQGCLARWMVLSPQMGWVRGREVCMTVEVGNSW